MGYEMKDADRIWIIDTLRAGIAKFEGEITRMEGAIAICREEMARARQILENIDNCYPIQGQK